MGSGLNFVNTQAWGDYIGQRLLAADSATMDISGIPPGYKFLVIMMCVRLEAAKPATTLLVRFNADAGNNYYFLKMYGQAGDVFGTAALNTSSLYASNVSAGVSASSQITLSQIPTAAFKSYWVVGGDSAQAFVTTGSWNSTNEINQVTLLTGSGDKFKAGSQFHIYGVR
jgi:hypothetical protein